MFMSNESGPITPRILILYSLVRTKIIYRECSVIDSKGAVIYLQITFFYEQTIILYIVQFVLYIDMYYNCI